MKTKEYKVWQVQFKSKAGETFTERINEYEDLPVDESIEDYIEDREDELYDDTDIEWVGEIINIERVRL